MTIPDWIVLYAATIAAIYILLPLFREEVSMEEEKYTVVLTPRTFQMSRPDWHIKVVTPSGTEFWDSSPRRWTAKLKARRIIRLCKKGKYKDKRQGETYYV